MWTAYFVSKGGVEFLGTEKELKRMDTLMTMLEYISYCVERGSKLVKLVQE